MKQVFPKILRNDLSFPDPANAGADGLLALGGDLSVPRLLSAYRSGIFPWSASPITWWSPDPRGIIELNDFHLSGRTLRRKRQNLFRVSINQAFKEVISACAQAAPGRDDTWIEPKIINAYTTLHQAGHAHSVECWKDKTLVGGVYGVAIAGFFAGESMFAHETDASKIALAFLIDHLKEKKFSLFDTQMVTPHTLSLGATTIPRSLYLQRLQSALQLSTTF
jgi:leucyl/phenylalanyl-tRNA--protein transferase